ncbi:hypothetical protein KPH14_000831 [Odynerus spinipes]|uniref:RNA-directed DNA polymerase n=1 Tax=Odynerus spinipes TaxID=1348599 RepID=A0AAD9VI06_9HYME|nr:hypothetical protein KPH14_000831 [Odynerus spinipes]
MAAECNRVVIPVKLRPVVLRLLHHNHPGIVRSKFMARSYVWWPKLDEDIEASIAKCVVCLSVQHAKPDKMRSPWPEASQPWERSLLGKETRSLNVKQRLADCLLSYRSTPTSVTGISPMASLLKFTPSTPLSKLIKREEERKGSPRNIRPMTSFKVGQEVLVLLKNSQGPVKWWRATVKLRLSPSVYLVYVHYNGHIRKVHLSQVRECRLPQTNDAWGEGFADLSLPHPGGKPKVSFSLDRGSDASVKARTDSDQQRVTTRFGRVIKPPDRFSHESYA